MQYRPEDENKVDLEQLRARLGRMDEAALIRFGKAAAQMCVSSFGKPPRTVFVIQLEEARAEWRRRKAK